MLEHLDGFEIFLLAGSGNPANVLAALATRPALRTPETAREACSRPWAVLFLSGCCRQPDALSEYTPAPHRGAAAPIYGGPSGLSDLLSWAAVESLNVGSIQRAKLDPDVRNALLGSGRWLAGDRGGWAALLRDSSLAWSRYEDRQREFTLASRMLRLDRRDVLGWLRPTADRMREEATALRVGRAFSLDGKVYVEGVDEFGGADALLPDGWTSPCGDDERAECPEGFDGGYCWGCPNLLPVMREEGSDA